MTQEAIREHQMAKIGRHHNHLSSSAANAKRRTAPITRYGVGRGTRKELRDNREKGL